MTWTDSQKDAVEKLLTAFTTVRILPESERDDLREIVVRMYETTYDINKNREEASGMVV